jgi:uncharacterized protein YlxW (UPF0749 family)
VTGTAHPATAVRGESCQEAIPGHATMSAMVPPDMDFPTRARRSSRAREAARTRRPDASMTLLVEVMEHPLDPGYAAAASRTGEAGRRRPRSLTTAVTVLVAMACGWVTTSAVVELRRPQPEAIRARAALEGEIQRRTDEVDRLQARNEALLSQIAAAQQAALAGNGAPDLLAQSETLGLVTGELPVTGPGLELTLDDAPGSGQQPGGVDPRQSTKAEQGRVIDHDLQVVVNGLWAAGAEAIAINGERLTALSAIRSAGQAILVDFRPLSPPYVIDAVGDPKRLESGFGEDVAGEYVKSLSNNYGIRSGMAAKTTMRLPGAGSLSLRYATSPSPSPAQSASSGTAGAPAPVTTTAGDGRPSSASRASGRASLVSPSVASPGRGSAVKPQEVFP